MAVPNIFGSATSAIPLSQLDQNFATAITLGNTAVYLGNTTTSLGNVTLTNVTISSGNVTVSAGSNTSPSITTVGDTNTGIFFPAADTIAFSEGGVESMRIDASGNVGIGSTTSNGKLTLKNTSSGSEQVMLAIQAASSTSAIGRITYDQTVDTLRFTNMSSFGGSSIRFGNNGLDQVMIDLSGNLLVGKTGTSVGTVGIVNLPAGKIIISNAATTAADDGIQIYSTGASAYRFFVTMGGVVNATSATITAISDQRLKENIRDLDDGLDVVMALKPRKFDWKEGKGADTKNARGFIAQEFETVFPDLIDTWKDEAPEGEEPYKAVRADLIPTLVKAIQELKALVDTQASTITALQADVAALKGTA